MYCWMLFLRLFDSRLMTMQRQGRISFFVPSEGEEALQIGTAFALRPEDWVFPAYREQGIALYRGYPLVAMFCQMLGNEHDLLKGRQMPNHFGSPQFRFAAASSPVGTQIPHAVGAAFSCRYRGESAVAAVFFGDGATSTGDFHAGLTFAAVWQAPVVFFCKNNGWAISLPTSRQCRAACLADKAAGYGLPGMRVDGNDVLAVYEAGREALELARSGGGPTLVEIVTQRMGPHSTADDPNRYREPAALDAWRERDPIRRFRAFLEAEGLWSEAAERDWQAECQDRLDVAVKEAESYGPPQIETLFRDVYAQQPVHLQEQEEEAQAWLT